MPTRHALALREHDARNRIRAAADALAERFEVDGIEEPAKTRNSDIGRIRDLSATADFLERLVVSPDKSKAKATPTPDADESPADGAQDAPDDGIREMTRAELNTAAARIGIESPEAFANKAELIAAINEAHAALPKADAPTPPDAS